jgi:hypothetical protein
MGALAARAPMVTLESDNGLLQTEVKAAKINEQTYRQAI